MKKIRFFLDLDKEIDYLNRMNEKGWKIAAISFGVCYHFVKADPGRYKTFLYYAGEDNQSTAIRNAIECGFDVVPHTKEDFRGLLYFNADTTITGEEFVTANEDKWKLRRRLMRWYRRLTIAFACLAAMMLLPLANVLPAMIQIYTHDAKLLWKTIGEIQGSLFTCAAIVILPVAFAVVACLFYKIFRKNKKIADKLSNEMKIYE